MFKKLEEEVESDSPKKEESGEIALSNASVGQRDERS